MLKTCGNDNLMMMVMSLMMIKLRIMMMMLVDYIDDMFDSNDVSCYVMLLFMFNASNIIIKFCNSFLG